LYIFSPPFLCIFRLPLTDFGRILYHAHQEQENQKKGGGSVKDMGIIGCSKEQAVPLIIGKDTVYVHTDIQEITVDDEFLGTDQVAYQCHEVQYGKDEYIQMMAEKNSELESQLTETQLALCDVFEMVVMM
ncbi:MAG: hypothetical protein LUG13_01785, partial [Oscillospiraceae bacterium]|nr:hypothetical protein [Oscillospiraceae bacterium]